MENAKQPVLICVEQNGTIPVQRDEQVVITTLPGLPVGEVVYTMLLM